MFAVSNVLKNKAAVAGAPGWVEQLPDLVAALADEWGFTPVRQLEGGTESFVVEVRLTDSMPAVLKLLVPREPGVAANEITVLQLADGDGCAACSSTITLAVPC